MTRERQRSHPEVDTRTQGSLARQSDDEEFEGRRSETVLALMSGVSRKGEWDPAELTTVFAVMGNASLDFTKAMLLDVMEVQVFSFCGSAKITVPEGVRVEVTGNALMGDFKQSVGKGGARRFLRRTLRAARGDYDDELEHDEDPPLIRVTGFALMGSVRVVTR